MYSRLPRSILSPAAATVARPSLRVGARFATATPFQLQLQPQPQPQLPRRCFHATSAPRKGIFPDSADPPAPHPESSNVAGAATHVTEPSPLTDAQYHDHAEHYLDVLQYEIEKVQEEGSDIEAEYSVRFYPSVILPSDGTEEEKRFN